MVMEVVDLATVLHLIKTIIVLLIYIILLPLILLWLGTRYLIYRYSFRKGMLSAGLSREDVRAFMNCR